VRRGSQQSFQINSRTTEEIVHNGCFIFFAAEGGGNEIDLQNLLKGATNQIDFVKIENRFRILQTFDDDTVPHSASSMSAQWADIDMVVDGPWCEKWPVGGKLGVIRSQILGYGSFNDYLFRFHHHPQ
jgi:hypothetical protein